MAELTVGSLGQALLDIMALHSPIQCDGGMCCNACMIAVETEPCPTVQVINAAFGRA